MFATLDSIEEAFREHDAHYAALLTQVREYDVSGDWSIDDVYVDPYGKR